MYDTFVSWGWLEHLAINGTRCSSAGNINAMAELFYIRAIIRDTARKFITARYAPRANSECAPRLIPDTECEKMFVQYPYSHLCCLNTIYRFIWNISNKFQNALFSNYFSQLSILIFFFHLKKKSSFLSKLCYTV